MPALDEARSFFEGTTERPLDHVEALAWDLLEQLEAEQQRRLQAVSLIPYEVWNELSRETRLRLTDGLAPVRPVSNPAIRPSE